MPTLKKPCINSPKVSYSGKETSPMGVGYAPDVERVGTVMDGRDGTKWIVGRKNNVNVWTRLPTNLSPDKPVINDAADAESSDAQVSSEVAPTPAPAKKPAAKKKPAAAKPAAADEDATVEPSNIKFEPVADVVKETDPEPPAPAAPAAAVAAPKKRAPAKKKAVPADAAPAGTADEAPAAAAPKVKKPPTDFNLFMAYRMKIMKAENPELNAFTETAKEWKTLSAEQKAEMVKLAKEAAKTK